GSTFTCALDAGAFAACSSPKQVSVGAGSHTFKVKATDLAGNTTASPATYTWSVLQAQTIDFQPLADVTIDQAPFGVSATATSNLQVSFSSLTTSTCSVTATTVTILALGTCEVEASQAGDGTTYGAAPNVDRSFTVRPPAPPLPLL